MANRWKTGDKGSPIFDNGEVWVSVKRRLAPDDTGLYLYESGYIRVAGPFDTLEAAKLAAEMLYG